MDEHRQDVQLGLTYNSSVPIQDEALKTFQKRWMIEMGGGRGSGRSMLMARHDDDDDDDDDDKEDFALNNQLWLICHKTKPNRTKLRQSVSMNIQ